MISAFRFGPETVFSTPIKAGAGNQLLPPAPNMIFLFMWLTGPSEEAMPGKHCYAPAPSRTMLCYWCEPGWFPTETISTIAATAWSLIRSGRYSTIWPTRRCIHHHAAKEKLEEVREKFPSGKTRIHLRSTDAVRALLSSLIHCITTIIFLSMF